MNTELQQPQQPQQQQPSSGIMGYLQSKPVVETMEAAQSPLTSLVSFTRKISKVSGEVV